MNIQKYITVFGCAVLLSNAAFAQPSNAEIRLSFGTPYASPVAGKTRVIVYAKSGPNYVTDNSTTGSNVNGSWSSINLRFDASNPAITTGDFTVTVPSGNMYFAGIGSGNVTAVTVGTCTAFPVQGYGIAFTRTAGVKDIRNAFDTLAIVDYTNTFTEVFTVRTTSSSSAPACNTRVSFWSNDNANNTLARLTLGTAPVVLATNFLNFTAAPTTDRKVLLNWVIGTEQNASYYEIERSINGSKFDAVITKVPAKDLGSEITEYSTVDNNPNMGDNYYRVKLTARDGSILYSTTQRVTFGGDQYNNDVRVFPNPFKGTVNLAFTAAADQKVNCLVTDVAGRTVYSKQLDVNKGATTIPVNLSVPAGTYFINITGASINKQVQLLKL